MKPSLVGTLALIIPLTACDLAATTVLSVRPVAEDAAAYGKSAPSSIAIISGALEEHGFERHAYKTEPGTSNAAEKMQAECGNPYYWLKSSRDTTGSFGTYGRVCLSGSVIRVSLSDSGRFSLSEPTKELRENLRQSLRQRFPGKEVTVE